LLGRALKLQFIIPADGSKRKIETKGTVIGVHYHLQNDYSIHIKFTGLLEESIIEAAEGTDK